MNSARYSELCDAGVGVEKNFYRTGQFAGKGVYENSGSPRSDEVEELVMQFSHSYSEGDPCSFASNSHRNRNVIQSFQPGSSQLLKLGQDAAAEEARAAEHSSHVSMAERNEEKKKKYSNTCTKNDLLKLLDEPEPPAIRLGIGPKKTNNHYASRRD